MERLAYGIGIPGRMDDEEVLEQDEAFDPEESEEDWADGSDPGGTWESADEDSYVEHAEPSDGSDPGFGAPFNGMRLRSPFEDWTMKRIGQEGERVAAKFLEELGFTILERNWMRAGREADIIARFEDTVVFVEVKTTVASPYDPDVMPELRVDERKRAKYRTIAGMYLQAHPHYPNARFDVIAVNLVEPGHSRLVHLEGAFTCDQI